MLGTSSSMQGSLVSLASILIVSLCTLLSRKQKVYWIVEINRVMHSNVFKAEED